MVFTESHIVAADETAATMGSGLLPVYATPAVVALMEHTACQLIAAIPANEPGALTEGNTTVGTRMAIDHLKACLPGSEVLSTAELLNIDGRQDEYRIEVKDASGNLLAQASHTRFLVSSERFMAKLQ